MATDPAIKRPPRLSGGRKAAAVVLAALLIGMTLLCWPRTPQPAPLQGSANRTPAAMAAAPLPAAEATPTLSAMANTKLDLPIFPVSNSFTTLPDYRRRRLARSQTPTSINPLPSGRTPETELGKVTYLVRDYRAAFGSNPVGSNKEITRALLGANQQGTRFLDPSTVNVDAKGEMLDAWGRPYFFHAMSATSMEIRSAGADGKMYTADDLVR